MHPLAAFVSSITLACPATPVHYQPAKHPTFGQLPWVLGAPARAGVVAYLPFDDHALADGRVNQATGLVMIARRRTKLFWWAWQGAGSSAVLAATRLDGRGSFRRRLRRDSGGAFPSNLEIPAPGCWRLTFRSGTARVSVVVHTVEPRGGPRCDATPVTTLGVTATPASAGIRGRWGWRTLSGGALIYAGGHTPSGGNTKVLWVVRRGWGLSLDLEGRRLDASGSFRQRFREALSPRGNFPSIVVVPTPGCWLLRVRTGRFAGILVVQSVPAA